MNQRRNNSEHLFSHGASKARGHGPAPRRFGLFLLLIGLFLAVPAAHAAQYFYDELGRLVEAVDNAGNAAAYVLDDNGNITNVARYTPGQLAIADFTPHSGPVGTQVSLYGSGFSTTPGANTVSFNGAAAVVTTATANQLIVRVPAGASTGRIAVTVGTRTVTTRPSFEVTLASQSAPPVITSFSPEIGAPGTAITITGRQFDPAPENDRVRFNLFEAQTLTASPSVVTSKVPGLASCGKLRLGTPNGIAVSDRDFYFYDGNPNDVDRAASQRLVVDGVTKAANIATGKTALLLFDAKAGQQLGLGLSNLATSPSNGSVNLKLIDSLGSVANISCNNAPFLAALQTIGGEGNRCDFDDLATDGTYTIAVQTQTNPPPAQSATFKLTLSSDLKGTLNPGGAALRFATTRSGQKGRYGFFLRSNAIPAKLVLTVYDVDAALNYSTVAVYDPSGALKGSRFVSYRPPICTSISVGTCHPDYTQTIDLVSLIAGTYEVRIYPYKTAVGAMKLWLGPPGTSPPLEDVPPTQSLSPETSP